MGRRFTYEEVTEILTNSPRLALAGSIGGSGPTPSPPAPLPEGQGSKAPDLKPEILALLLRIRDLALILHKRRIKRGSLELMMPEIQLEYNDQGKVSGAHFRKHDISHTMVEECMLAANESVAEHLDRKDIYFLRRVHPAPEPTKLQKFAEFARILGYKIKSETDRFTLQRILQQSANKPEMHAVHYASAYAA